MKKALVFLSVAVLAACGGGGGGGIAPSTPAPRPTGTAKPTPSPTPTPTPFTAVHVTFSTTPVAVAKQVGTTSAWQSATPAPNVEIDLPIPTTVFGLAYVCPAVTTTQGATNQEIVLQATTTDATAFTAPCPASSPAPVSANISGTFDVSAIPNATRADVFESYWMLGGSGGVTGTYGGAGSVGTSDLVALALNGYDVVGAKILRNQSITNNVVINIPPFDASDVSTTETINQPQLITGFIPNGSLDYVTAGGTHAQVINPSTQATYGSIPASETAAGDYYDLNYTQTRVVIGGQETVAVEQTFTTPGAVSIVLPRGPQFYTIGAAPYPMFTFDNASLSISGKIFDQAQLSWGTNPTGYSVTAYVSSSWIGNGNTYAIPNLSSLTGFFPAPQTNTPVNWVQSSNIMSAPLFSALGGSLPIGVNKQSVTVNGNFTEP